VWAHLPSWQHTQDVTWSPDGSQLGLLQVKGATLVDWERVSASSRDNLCPATGTTLSEGQVYCTQMCDVHRACFKLETMCSLDMCASHRPAVSMFVTMNWRLRGPKCTPAAVWMQFLQVAQTGSCMALTMPTAFATTT
jgi:hypothetical protein